MDAIHIMPGQNGRSGRTDTAPPTAATDLGAAFSRALAALDRGAPKETAGEVEAPPEEDGVAIEEATAESDATADGETRSEDEAPVDGTLNGDLEHAAPVTAGPIEEEFLPLVMGEAATTAALADGSADSPAPTARSGLSPLQALVPAGTAPEISRASLGQQDATTTLTGAPASEAHSVPASSSAQTAAPVQPNVILPAMPREGASILPRVAATPISVMTDAEPASDADVIEPDGEIADVRVAPKAAGTDRYIPQNQPPITLPATTKVPIEAKADDGMRLQADAVSLVQVELGASPSRSTPAAIFAPTAEARPVLNSIVEATVKAQNGTIELRLSPEELGRVRISMSHHEQGMSVVLNVEREDTLHLLRRHASELAAALREAGLGEATIEFANREQRSPSDPQRQAPKQAFGVFSDAGAEIDRSILRPLGDGGLDIRM